MSANDQRFVFNVFVAALSVCLSGGSLSHADLVAHWPLNEGSGEVFRDVVGGHDGFLPEAEFGEVTEVEWDEGPPTQDHAVRFLDQNSFIATDFPGIGEDGARTVTFWFKTLDNDAYFLGWGSTQTGRKWHLRLNGADGTMRTEFMGGQNFATTNVIDDEWHHFASVFPEGSFEGADILHYLDGELDPQTGGTSIPIDTAVGEGLAEWTDANSSEAYYVHFGAVLGHGFGRQLDGLMADVRIYDEGLSQERIQAIFEGRDPGGVGGAPRLMAGDADMDLDFDQVDLVRVQIAAKYLTGQPATWGEGDWDGAPGGEPGSPPAGNGFFDQLDIISALGAGIYLTGPYAAIAPGGAQGDEQTSIVYNPGTGELAVDAPAGTELTSINIDSSGAIFTGAAAMNLGGSFDNDADNNIFKATFGSSFGSLTFGNVARTGLSEDFVLNDLTVIGSLAGGGDLGDVDLIYVPEPRAAVLALLGALCCLVRRRSSKW